MALSDFLSAIRELILDDGLADLSVEDRRTSLEARFTRLSADQLDDLASIPPGRLQTYTDLIFAGERSTLEWVFPVSFEVIHRIRAAGGDDRPPRLADFEMVRALHRFRPWKSSSQRRLAADFADFIRVERTDWLEVWGGLEELVEFERSELDVFYAEDVAHERFTPQVAESLVALSVEELMMRRIVLPAYVVVRRFQYDIASMVHRYRKDGTISDPLPAPTLNRAACGRAPESLMARWVNLAAVEFDCLRRLPRDRGIEINDFAAVYLELRAGEEVPDEKAAFAEFFEVLLRLLGSGVLLFSPSADERGVGSR
ncbi:hypothetical protein B7486_01285 [cyanobacterium TDX16]|nr:hypothetical protein B7486_01285 [cyanobacterium TDX16]